MTNGNGNNVSQIKVLLTCSIDLSEYMSSMVLWILVILPWRSDGGTPGTISECTTHFFFKLKNADVKTPTTGVVFHLTPPAMQAALQHPQLLLSDVAWGRVHGEVRGETGLGKWFMNGYSLLLGCTGSWSGTRGRAWALQRRQGVLLSCAVG